MGNCLSSLVSAAEAVFKSSWQAAVLIVIVFGLQAALRTWLSARWRFALWYLVLARLVIPVFPGSPLSLFNYAQPPRVRMFQGAADRESPRPQVFREPRSHGHITIRNAAKDFEYTAPETTALQSPVLPPLELPQVIPGKPLLSGKQFLGLIWLFGALFLGVRLAWNIGSISRLTRGSEPIENELVQRLLEECKCRIGVKNKVRILKSDNFKSPCLIGFFKPRLQMPSLMVRDFSEQELRLIFLHELAHVKRRDIAINWIGTLAQIVHWFNPLVWLALNRMRADRELACDALALTVAGEQQRGAYGDTIIRLLEGYSKGPVIAGSVGILEGRHRMKERIRMIARFRVPSRWSFLAIPLLTGIGVICLTDAQVPGASPNPDLPQKAQGAERADAKPQMVVHVVSETGEPIAQATVQANYFTPDDSEGHDMISDAEGIARVPTRKHPEQPISGMNLWVVAPGFVPKRVRWNRYNIPVEYTFKLPPATAVSGRVVNLKGEPVPDVQIRVEGSGLTNERDEEIQFHPRLNAVTTDSAGRWRCNFIPTDFKEVRLILTHPNYAVTLKTVELPNGFSQQNRLVLERANTIKGRILDTQAKPIADATVREVHNFGWRRAWVKSDANGNFILEGLRSAKTLVVVQAEGRTPEVREFNLTSDENGVEFRMKKGDRVAGHVTDQFGEPVAGVQVGTGADDKGLVKVEFKAQTDSAGRFKWNSAPEEPLLFDLRSPGIEFVHDLELGPGEHEIKVKREGLDRILITGRVIDNKTGEPVRSFHVTVGESELTGWNNWTSLGTDGNSGEFKLPIGKPAPYPQFVLQITAPGFFPMLSSNLTVNAGDQRLEFRMKKGQHLTGAVFFPNGKPVAGVPVFFCVGNSAPYIDKPGEAREPMERASTLTGPDGTFQLDPRADQQGVVIVHADGYLEIPIDEFEKSNRFILEPYGRIEGTLYINGKSAAGETITVSSKVYPYEARLTERGRTPFSSVWLTTETDEKGHFVIEKVPPGERQIWQVLNFREEKGVPRIIPTTHETYVRVKAGETSKIDLGLGGQKVVGMIRLKNAPERFDWSHDVQQLQPKPPISDLPLVNDFPNRKEWISAFQKTAEADRAFRTSKEGREFEQTHRRYAAMFDENGSFVINDVLPGKYTFLIRLTTPTKPGTGASNGFPFPGPQLAETNITVLVPTASQITPVDLGTIELEAKSPDKNRAATR